MKPAKIAVICIAAVAAIGLALVVRAMGSSSQQPAATAVAAVEPPPPMAKVLVAARDLQPGARLADADMAWKDWPVAEVNPIFITDGSVPVPQAAKEDAGAASAVKTAEDKAKGAVTRAAEAVNEISTGGAKADYVGAVVREAILAGEPIVARKIVRAGDSGYMAAYLEPGMRAMAIRVTVETAAGGFILPGDRADVILTREVKSPAGAQGDGNPRFVSSTVMQNVKVLAIDQAIRAADDAMAVVGATSYADTSGPSGRTPGATRNEASAARAVRVYRAGQAETVAVP